MPLARFALYERGVEIYLAPTADDSDDWHDSIRHIARESRAFVLSLLRLPARRELPGGRSARGRRRPARPRRLGDPRAGRQLPRGAALGRGGHPLRRSRPDGSLGGAPALRPGGSLPPPRRALADGHAAAVKQRDRRRRRRVRGVDARVSSRCRGWDVTLVEQYAPGTVRSASGGDTRLLRMAHGDVEWYTPARTARARALARAAGVDRHPDLGAGRRRVVRAAATTASKLEAASCSAGSGSPTSGSHRRRRPGSIPSLADRRSARRALRAGRRRAARAARDAAARRGRRSAGGVRLEAQRALAVRRRRRRHRRLGVRRLAAEAVPARGRADDLAPRRLLLRRRTRLARHARLLRLRRRGSTATASSAGSASRSRPTAGGDEVDPDTLERVPSDGATPRGARLRRAPVPVARGGAGGRLARVPVRPDDRHALRRRPPPGARLAGGSSAAARVTASSTARRSASTSPTASRAARARAVPRARPAHGGRGAPPAATS